MCQGAMCLCSIFDKAMVTGHWETRVQQSCFHLSAFFFWSSYDCSSRVVIDSRPERDGVLLRCGTMWFKSFLEGTKCGIVGHWRCRHRCWQHELCRHTGSLMREERQNVKTKWIVSLHFQGVMNLIILKPSKMQISLFLHWNRCGEI